MADAAETNHNKYLESPKAFHLEMPLYYVVNITKSNFNKIYGLLSYYGTLDVFCIWCDKESVFETDEYFSASPGDLADYGFKRISYKCSRDSNHKYYVYHLISKAQIQKVGQFPSVADFQIPQAEKYRKVLGDDQYKELTKGIGLAAHGVGIGSFVYLRRIFSNLIHEAYVKAKVKYKVKFVESEYKDARMDGRIKLLEEFLPQFLVQNRTLYSILSKGVHELSEEECLKYFATIRIGIEQILDEKIDEEQKLIKAENARKAVQSVSQDISKDNN